MKYIAASVAPNGPFVAVDTERFLRQHSGHSFSNVYETSREAQDLADWLNERDAGYPSLKKFEGGANWPVGFETWRKRAGALHGTRTGWSV